jgi:hypothetical protein
MDRNVDNYYGMNSCDGLDDRGAQQRQRQAQAEQAGQAQQFQMAGAAQLEVMAGRSMASDYGSSPVQQPSYQHTRLGKAIGFIQSCGGAPVPFWAEAYQMPPAGGFSSTIEALGQPAAEFFRHISFYQQLLAYSGSSEQHSMRMLHVRRECSTYTQDFRLALVMIA